MTDAEIDALEGQALDAEVARTIFHLPHVAIRDRGVDYHDDRLGVRRWVPEYYADWAAMGLLVAEMKRRGWQWHGGDGNGPNRGLQWAMFDHDEPLTVADATGDTLPTATARAALLLVTELGGNCAQCGGPLVPAGYARWHCDACNETTDACGVAVRTTRPVPAATQRVAQGG